MHHSSHWISTIVASYCFSLRGQIINGKFHQGSSREAQNSSGRGQCVTGLYAASNATVPHVQSFKLWLTSTLPVLSSSPSLPPRSSLHLTANLCDGYSSLGRQSYFSLWRNGDVISRLDYDALPRPPRCCFSDTSAFPT